MILSTELKMLLCSIVLGIVQLILAAHMSTLVRGLKWNLSSRDGNTPELTGVAGRVERSFKNFKETFSFFAAAILIVQITGSGNNLSALGAHMYFWARLAYIPVYALGITGMRTIVWVVSMIGIALVLATTF